MKFSLATKIFLGFSLVLTVFGTVPIFGLARLNSVRDQLNVVNRTYLPIKSLVAEIDAKQNSIRMTIDSVLKFNELDIQRRQMVSLGAYFRRNMKSRITQAKNLLRRIDPKSLSTRDSAFIPELKNRLKNIKNRTDEYSSSIEWMVKSLEIQPLSKDEISGLRRIGRKLSREVRVLELNLKNMIASKMLSLEQDESSAIGVLIWLTILALLVGVIVTTFSLLSLRPIKRLAAAARSISKGDFSPVIDIESNDEFGLLGTEFNNMARSLSQRQQQLVRQQKQLEEVNRQLRQSSIDLALMKLYNEHIIRSLHNGILVADATGEITTINPAAQKLWGLNPEHTVGKRLSELPIAKFMKELIHSWEKVLRQQQHLLFESLEFLTNDDRQVLVDLYVSPLLGTGGDTQGVLLVGQDVTEQVRTKQALIHSERLAAIGRMSAVVAHEIRNPLSSIGLNTELLQEEVDEAGMDSGSEAQSILSSISKEVERLTEVTDAYLHLARLPKPNLGPHEINTILDDLLRFMSGEFETKGIELVQELDPEAGLVDADDSQIRQALLNLLKNSSESINDGGVLTVRTKRINKVVQICISDTGKGIAEDDLDRIFEPFFSTREGGTGLGLALTQQIISEHGGSIDCESSVGDGTTFTVKLRASDMGAKEE